jgi:hypothetical protein
MVHHNSIELQSGAGCSAWAGALWVVVAARLTGVGTMHHGYEVLKGHINLRAPRLS